MGIESSDGLSGQRRAQRLLDGLVQQVLAKLREGGAVPPGGGSIAQAALTRKIVEVVLEVRLECR